MLECVLCLSHGPCLTSPVILGGNHYFHHFTEGLVVGEASLLKSTLLGRGEARIQSQVSWLMLVS